MPILTDRVAWSVGLSVDLSVTLVSPAITAAPIELPVWVEDLGGPGNHVLDGAPDSLIRRNFFFGGGEDGRPIVNYRDTLRSSVQRRLNR